MTCFFSYHNDRTGIFIKTRWADQVSKVKLNSAWNHACNDQNMLRWNSFFLTPARPLSLSDLFMYKHCKLPQGSTTMDNMKPSIIYGWLALWLLCLADIQRSLLNVLKHISECVHMFLWGQPESGNMKHCSKSPIWHALS